MGAPDGKDQAPQSRSQHLRQQGGCAEALPARGEAEQYGGGQSQGRGHALAAPARDLALKHQRHGPYALNRPRAPRSLQMKRPRRAPRPVS